MKTVQDIINATEKTKTAFSNSFNAGANRDAQNGFTLEFIVRAYIENVASRTIRRAKAKDATAKIDGEKIRFEIKSGAGALAYNVEPSENGEIDLDKIMKNVDVVAYCAHVQHFPTVYFVPRAEFLDILDEFGLIRYKKATSGAWNVAIQNYIPTPSFKPSVKKMQAVFDALASADISDEIFG